MAVQDEHDTAAPDEVEVDLDADADADAPRSKAMTIGAVCKALEQEFPDISISKIRYLGDQKLLSPRRTPGGYRLYSAGDVIITGSITPPLMIEADDTELTHLLEPIGEVSVRFSRN